MEQSTNYGEDPILTRRAALAPTPRLLALCDLGTQEGGSLGPA
jgi:hypothetical protein